MAKMANEERCVRRHSLRRVFDGSRDGIRISLHDSFFSRYDARVS